MANWMEPTPEQVAVWEAWVSERPEAVREVIRRHDFKLWKLYFLKTANQRVTIASFDEPLAPGPVTLKVDVLARFNFVTFERRVFGVDPRDLIECDLPPSHVPLGAVLTLDEVKAAVDGVPPGEPRRDAVHAAATQALADMKPRGDA